MNLIKIINELQANKKSYCIATVVKTVGSTPGKVGFKYILDQDKNAYGTIGGGAIEVKVAEECEKKLKINRPELKEYILTDKEVENELNAEIVPMMCSGKMWIFYETYNVKHTVYIFGGGHVGKELTYFLKPLNYEVVLIDNRPDTKNEFADELIIDDYNKFSLNYNFRDNSFFVVLTQGHTYDYVVVKNILSRGIKHRYIGVIASKIKANKLKEMLKEELGNKPEIDLINSPIGIDIGGETASEIALSIAAQMQSYIYKLG